MNVSFARPDASQLAFLLFERTLHPELFDTYAEAQVVGDRFEAVLRICDAGHVVEFRNGGQRVTEVVGSLGTELPLRGRCVAHPLKGGRDLNLELDGLAYCCSAHVEQLDVEVFSEIHDELSADASKALLAYEFPGPHRLQKGALSVMQAEVTSDSLLIHAFHTFPESLSVLRTQSLYEY
jgi:hypothetical protein